MTKIIVTAIALAFAFPAAAQTAPASQHQGHGEHSQGQGPAGHGQHQPGQHEGHEAGCCADRNGNGRMDCCEQAAAAAEPCACCQHGDASGDHHGH